MLRVVSVYEPVTSQFNCEIHGWVYSTSFLLSCCEGLIELGLSISVTFKLRDQYVIMMIICSVL